MLENYELIKRSLANGGTLVDWISGSNFVKWQGVFYNNNLYRTLNKITNSIITPDLDTTNFEKINMGSVSLKDLQDVEFVTVTDGQVTVYDNTLGKWINKTLKHDDLADKNGNPDYQHITQTEKDTIFNTLDDHTLRIEALESGGTSGGLSLLNDSNLNGKTVDYHTVTKVSYKITGVTTGDVLEIFDPSKVSITGGIATLGTPVIVDNSGTKYVEVPINNLTYGINYKITVSSGLVSKNSTTLSGSAFLTSFITANAPSAPTINADTLLSGQHNLDPSTVLKVSFPVTHSGVLSLADGTKFTSTPTNIVNGSFVLNGDNLEADLHNVDEDRIYTISVLGGIVANDVYTLNSTGNSSTFSTRASIPVVGQGNLNGNTSVDGNTVHKIDFPLSTPTGRGTLVLKDSSKITVTQGSATIASSIVSGNTLSVLLNNLIDGDSIKVKVDTGAIGNDDGFGNIRLQDTAVESSFTMMIHQPTITQSTLNGNLDVSLTTSEITYSITSTLACTLDTSKITLTPSAIANGSAFISGNTIHIPIHNLNYDINVTVNLGVGVIKNGGSVANTSATNTTFQCTSSEPILTNNGDLDGNGAVNYTSTNQVNFAVNTTVWNTISLNNSKIVFKENGVTKSISSASFNSTTKVLTVGVNLNADKNYTLEIQSGALSNRNVANTTGVICSFSTASTFSISNSTSNGTNIPKTSTKVISFPYVNNIGTVSIVDPSKCTGSNCTIDSVVVNGSNIDVQISGFNYSTNVSVKIDAGLAKDSTSGMTNQNSLITCTMHVMGDDVVVGTSPSDTLQTVPLSTTQITFPLTTVHGGSLTSTTVNASLVTCSVANRISSVSVVGTNLIVNLMNLVNDESLTINVASNAITNDSNNTSSAKSATFKIIKQTPVIGQTSINGTRVDKTLTTVDFPISSVQGTLTTVASILTLITSTNCTVSGATILTNNTLRLTISGLDYSKVVTIGLPANIIDNGEVKNNNTISTTFTVKGDSVVVGASSVDNTTVSQGLTSVTFPLTTTNSGALDSSISVNSSLITCDVAGTIASSSVVGTNLVVNLNTLAYNQVYNFTVGANAITNGTTNVSNAQTCKITTKMQAPIIGQSTVNGTKIDKSTAQILFPITVNGSGLSLISASGITSTGGLTVGTVSVDGANNLVIPISGLTYSGTYSITIPVNTVKNSTTNNSASITCNFGTKGDVPIIGDSVDNNTTDVALSKSEIVFPLTMSSGIWDSNLTVDTSKITCDRGGILGTPIIRNNGSNKELVLPISSLTGNTEYNFTISIGAINNGTTLSNNSKTCKITTVTASNPIDWSYEFKLSNMGTQYILNNDSTWIATGKTITDEDVYADVIDGGIQKVKLYYLGYDGGTLLNEEMPRTSIDSFSTTSLELSWSYASDTTIIQFEGSSQFVKKYKLIKYL